MRKKMTMAAISAALAAIALTAQPNTNADKKQNATPDKNPAVILAAPNHDADTQENKNQSSANPPRANTPLPDPNWVLVIVGSITCVVIGWQSVETRRAAQAALIQANLQAVTMRQWVEVRVISVRDVGHVQSETGSPIPSGKIEIRLEAVNRTPYPLTVEKAKALVHIVDTDEDYVFTCHKGGRLIPGDYKGSRIEMYIPMELTDDALTRHRTARLMFSIAGVIVFNPAVGPPETQEYGFLARPGTDERAELPLAIEMTREDWEDTGDSENPN